MECQNQVRINSKLRLMQAVSITNEIGSQERNASVSREICALLSAASETNPHACLKGLTESTKTHMGLIDASLFFRKATGQAHRLHHRDRVGRNVTKYDKASNKKNRVTLPKNSFDRDYTPKDGCRRITVILRLSLMPCIGVSHRSGLTCAHEAR